MLPVVRRFFQVSFTQGRRRPERLVNRRTKIGKFVWPGAFRLYYLSLRRSGSTEYLPGYVPVRYNKAAGSWRTGRFVFKVAPFLFFCSLAIGEPGRFYRFSAESLLWKKKISSWKVIFIFRLLSFSSGCLLPGGRCRR